LIGSLPGWHIAPKKQGYSDLDIQRAMKNAISMADVLHRDRDDCRPMSEYPQIGAARRGVAVDLMLVYRRPILDRRRWRSNSLAARVARSGIRLTASLALLLAASCSTTGTGSTVCQCPKPVAYDDATIEKITAALRALPSNNVLQEAMDDYEDERDALRICIAGGH
jgi:hypothetical protein